MDPKAHWENVYRTRRPRQVSWYRPHLETSLALIAGAVPDRDARIIDVGGGESTLVGDLIAIGYRDLTVLDISATALQVAKERLEAKAFAVRWLCGDVTTFAFADPRYDLWHDRAVFHFLTEAAAREAYVRQVARAVHPGGYVIVAAFGPEGPTKCSGLEVARYDAAGLHAQFGSNFRLIEHATEMHRTPSGMIQQFVYCFCRLRSEPDEGSR